MARHKGSAAVAVLAGGFLMGWGLGSLTGCATEMAVAAPQAVPAHHDLWLRVARCEQPGRGYGGVNWRHRGSGHDGGYQGGLGFAASSWDAYKPKGYPANAGDATWRQQMVVANRLWARAGWGWGCRG